MTNSADEISDSPEHNLIALPIAPKLLACQRIEPAWPIKSPVVAYRRADDRWAYIINIVNDNIVWQYITD